MTDQANKNSQGNIPDTLDKFQVLEKIASGGMGIVYRAKDTALAGKLVALKVLKADTKDTDSLVRFQNEARILVRLSHPNIATAYDFGISKNGEPFMAIEFIDGVTLREVLSAQGRLSVDETLTIALQVCDALSYAHSKGVVHRDIQPGNIIITTGDTGKQTIKIIDFGIAKEESSAHLTKHGQWIGSPLYISPEQCCNQEITVRSDMYSLGCVLYHCLVGRPPLRGDTSLDTIRLHMEQRPQPLAEALPEGDFPPELCTIVERLLEKQPELRYDSMEKVGRRLSRILYGAQDAPQLDATPDTVPEVTTIQATDPKATLLKTALIFAALFVPAVIFLGITLGDWLSRDENAPISAAKHSASLEQLRNLLAKGETEISLTECKLTDDDLKEFEKYPKVQRLEVTGIEITDEGLKYLEGTNIGRLEVKDTNVKTLAHLPNKERLGTLFLRGTRVNDESMKNVLKCPKMESLDVAGTQVTMKGLEMLGSLPLKELYVGEMTKKDMDRLGQLFPFCMINHEQSFTDHIRNETEVLLDSKRGPEAFSTCAYWLKIARDRKNYPFEVFCLTGMGYIDDRMKKHQEADVYWKDAIAIGEKHDCSFQMATTYSVAFRRLVNLDRMDEAVEIAHKLIKNLDKLDIDHLDRAGQQIDTALALVQFKRPKEGIKIIEGTLESLNKRFAEHRSRQPSLPWTPDDRFLHAQAEVALGHAFQQDGDLRLARQHIASGLSAMKKLGGKPHAKLIDALMRAAAVEHLDKNFKKSLEFNDEALKLASKNMPPSFVAVVLEQRHTILVAMGRTADAKQIESELRQMKGELQQQTRSGT